MLISLARTSRSKLLFLHQSAHFAKTHIGSYYPMKCNHFAYNAGRLKLLCYCTTVDQHYSVSVIIVPAHTYTHRLILHRKVHTIQHHIHVDQHYIANAQAFQYTHVGQNNYNFVNVFEHHTHSTPTETFSNSYCILFSRLRIVKFPMNTENTENQCI